MPEITGISLAESLKTNTKVIFTTAYRDYAVEGFDLQVVDYLLKPISFERFFQAYQKYKSEVTPELVVNRVDSEVEFIFVRSDRKNTKVRFEEVLYIESLSDIVNIHTKTNTVTTRESISNLELKLPTRQFFRIHRSFIVALNQITSYTHEYVELGQKQLPISRSFRESVLSRLEG